MDGGTDGRRDRRAGGGREGRRKAALKEGSQCFGGQKQLWTFTNTKALFAIESMEHCYRQYNGLIAYDLITLYIGERVEKSNECRW